MATATAPATSAANAATPHVGVAIIGTGFAGLAVALALQKAGRTDFVLLEKAHDVGGTWRDNTYPGCQCDVPSILYSLADHPNPNWSRTYSPQPEIQAYMQRIGALVPAEHKKFGSEVLDARWNDDAQHWVVTTTQGQWTADALVSGHGGLSVASTPDIPGVDTFAGEAMHSATWNPNVVLRGKRVAVVGTGASAIQIVPRIQPHVAGLTLFQRTPPWVLPSTDRPTRAVERAVYRQFPAVQRAVRGGVYWLRELIFLAMARPSWLTRRIERMARAHLERQVPDPQLRATLTPDYAPGCKRLLLSNGYYKALGANNVAVVTEKIAEVRPHAIVTADGTEHEVDVIVWATGFKVTDNPVLEVIKGRSGRSLKSVWADTGLQAYLGTTVPDFPNLFIMTGPNTGLGHNSLVFMIESQVTYVLGALREMQQRRLASVEVRSSVVDRYNAGIQRKMAPTVWASGGCASWYLDAQGRNTTLWPDYSWKYRLRTRRFDIASYDTVPATARRAPAVAR